MTNRLASTSETDAVLRASVVIPAHNEATVIERCLDALFTGVMPGTLDVVVACNGCRDDTAERAQRSGHPVRVLELSQASKAAALRAGDDAARWFPRLYLDADIVLPGAAALCVIERLSAGAVVARPPLRYDSSRSTSVVRSYYRARARMPAVLRSLWGAGVYGLSAGARSRFDTFPDVTSDDLWLDLQFEPDEVEIVDCEPVWVSVPRGSRDLLTVLQRTYKGKAEHRCTPGVQTRARATTVSALHDIRRLAGSGVRGALDAATYVTFALAARCAFSLRAALTPGAASAWERDESSRVA